MQRLHCDLSVRPPLHLSEHTFRESLKPNEVAPRNFRPTVIPVGAWGSVVLKALRYKSEGPRIDSVVAGVFSVSSESSMCPGVHSASENEYQVNPGGKGGLCVRLKTYHLHVPMSRNLGALTCGPVQACNGTSFSYPCALDV
jgi:hypothetical protein